MALFIRMILFIWIIVIAYLIINYIFNPKRKLELAQQKGDLFILDDPKNTRKNMLITYKGALFEGEKYLGTADEAFRIIHIKIWTDDKTKLHGISKQDLIDIEQIIIDSYPYALIEWASPMKELIKK